MLQETLPPRQVRTSHTPRQKCDHTRRATFAPNLVPAPLGRRVYRLAAYMTLTTILTAGIRMSQAPPAR